MSPAIFEGTIELGLGDAAKLQKQLQQVRQAVASTARQLASSNTEFQKNTRSATSYAAHVSKAMQKIDKEFASFGASKQLREVVEKATKSIFQGVQQAQREAFSGMITSLSEAATLADKVAKTGEGITAAFRAASRPVTDVTTGLNQLSIASEKLGLHTRDLPGIFASLGVSRRDFNLLQSAISSTSGSIRYLQTSWEATGELAPRAIARAQQGIDSLGSSLGLLVTKYPELAGSPQFAQLSDNVFKARDAMSKSLDEIVEKSKTTSKTFLEGVDAADRMRDALARIQLPGGLSAIASSVGTVTRDIIAGTEPIRAFATTVRELKPAMENAKLGFMLATRSGATFTERVKGITFALGGAQEPAGRIMQAFLRIANVLDGGGNAMNRFAVQAQRLTQELLDASMSAARFVVDMKAIARAEGFGDKAQEFNIMNRDATLLEGALRNMLVAFQTTGRASGQAVGNVRQALSALEYKMAEVESRSPDMFASPALRKAQEGYLDFITTAKQAVETVEAANKASIATQEKQSQSLRQATTVIKEKFVDLNKVVIQFSTNISIAFKKMTATGVNVTARAISTLASKVSGATKSVVGLGARFTKIGNDAKKAARDNKELATSLEATSKAASQAKQETSDLGTSLEDAARKGALLGTVLGTIVVKAAELVAQKLAEGMRELGNVMKEAARVEVLEDSLVLLAHTAGKELDYVKSRVEILKNTGITTKESLVSVSKFLTTKLPLERIDGLARAAQNMAVVFGVNSTQAFQRFSQAILTGNFRLLKQLGINQYATDVYKRYGASIGKAAQELTAAERRLATMNMIMEQAQPYMGAYERAMDQVGKQLTSLPRYIEEARISLGRIFVPILGAGVTVLTKFAKSAQETFAGLEPTIRPVMEKVRDVIVGAYDKIAGTLSDIFGSIANAVKTLWEAAEPIISEIRSIFGYYLPMIFAGLRGVIREVLDHIKSLFSGIGNLGLGLLDAAKKSNFLVVILDLLQIGLKNIIIIIHAVASLLRGDFAAAAFSMRDAVENAIAMVVYLFESLISKALDWGWNLVQSWATGFVNAASDVITKVLTWFGNQIANFLAAFSPPRKGPLRNIVRWAVKTMNTYLEGFGEAEFDILDAALAPIEKHLSRKLTMAGVDDTKVIEQIANVRLQVTELVEGFRETGRIPVAALDKLAQKLGEGGAQLTKLIRLQMVLENAQKRLEAAQERVNVAREAGFIPTALQKGLDTAQAEVSEAEKQLKLQQRLLKYQQSNLDLLARLEAAMKKLADAIGKAKKEMVEAPKLPTPPPLKLPIELSTDDEGVTSFSRTVSKRFLEIKAAVSGFLDLPFKEKFDAIIKKLEDLTGLDITGFIEDLGKLKDDALALLNRVDWELLGTKISGFFETVFGFVVNLYNRVDWEKIKTSVLGFFTNVKDTIVNTYNNIDWEKIGLAISGFFTKISTAIGDFLATIDWEKVKTTLGDFVDGILGFFQDLYNKLVGESILPDLVKDAKAWWDKFVAIFSGPVDFVKGIGEAFDRLKEMISNIVLEVGEFLAKTGFVEDAEGFQDKLGGVIGTIFKIGAVIAIVVGVIALAMPTILGIAGTIGGVVASIGGFIGTVSVIGGAIGTIISAIAPILAVIGVVVAGIIDLIKTKGDELGAIWEEVSLTFGDMWRRLEPALKPIIAVIKAVLGAIAGIVIMIGSTLLGVIKGLWLGVKRAWTGIKTIIVGVVTTIWGILQVTLIPILNIIIALFDFMTGNSEEGKESLLAAWDSFKRGFDNIIKGFGTIIMGLIEAIGGFVTGFLQGLFQAVGGALEWILRKLGLDEMADKVKQSTENIVGVLGALWEGLKVWVEDTVEKISEAATDVWEKGSAGWTKFKESIEIIIAHVGLKISEFVEGIKTWWENLKADAVTMWENLKTEVETKVSAFVTAIVLYFTSLYNDAKQLWEDIKAAVIDAVTGFKDDVEAKVTEFIDNVLLLWEEITTGADTIATALEDIADTIATWIEGVAEDIASTLEDWADTVATWIEDMVADVTTFFTDLDIEGKVQEIIDAVTGFADSFLQAGRDLIQGFLDGLKEKWEMVKSWMVDRVKALPGWVKDPLGIKSPSKVFAAIGRQLAEGLSVGFDKGLDVGDIQKTINVQVSALTGDFERGLRPAPNYSTIFNAGAIQQQFPNVAQGSDVDDITRGLRRLLGSASATAVLGG